MNDALFAPCMHLFSKRPIALALFSAVIVLGWVVGTATAAHDPAGPGTREGTAPETLTPGRPFPPSGAARPGSRPRRTEKPPQRLPGSTSSGRFRRTSDPLLHPRDWSTKAR